ncbi:transglycosylase family protein [Actinomycetospora callitridis]|jgi:resuscitation-promoting factor RpfA|uniref:transglycosylase family protein n=1 Tax=Actinomycetospora callitridis TaxID=913944 RepID=UPI002365FFE6|nr:transglycosylase family protein [Actinomycetospora callitridis]MDD7921045.1 transglycosylase family protein [Actinomycetospora callitridis]
MSGRHAAPSASRPLLKAGVVAAAAVTGPLAITGTAMAAPSVSPESNATWDRLAMCESTQNWEADTGNGFKGGLQFTDSTWSEFGGERFASSPDEASREQQIRVAKKVQDEQGWNAWPTCSEKLGLQ